jgi:hypothetical protein
MIADIVLSEVLVINVPQEREVKKIKAQYHKSSISSNLSIIVSSSSFLPYISATMLSFRFYPKEEPRRWEMVFERILSTLSSKFLLVSSNSSISLTKRL